MAVRAGLENHFFDHRLVQMFESPYHYVMVAHRRYIT
jgi:hypothetical protein